MQYFLLLNFSGAFRLYDVDNDGYITREEMYNIVEAIYQMVVSIYAYICSTFIMVTLRIERNTKLKSESLKV